MKPTHARVCKESLGVLVASVLLPLAAGASAEVDSATCGDGVLVRLSSDEAVQGSLKIIEVRGDEPLTTIEGAFDERAIHFWPSQDGRVHQAFLAVDLQQRAGEPDAVVEGKKISGKRFQCSVSVSVREGDFKVQRLTVDPGYVELSPENAERAVRESRELARIFSDVTFERFWDIGFRLPVSGYPASGSFGRRRVLNGKPRSPHSGEDYPAPAGTEVRATARGRVVLAKPLFFLGNTVIIDHGYGLYSYYGHLEEIAVATGNLIDHGELLGRVGASGRVTGAHLHWGVRLNKARVNPKDLLLSFPATETKEPRTP